MSLKAKFYTFLFILLIAAGVGGGIYYTIHQRQLEQTAALEKAFVRMADAEYEEALGSLNALLEGGSLGATEEAVRGARIYAMAKLGKSTEVMRDGRVFLDEFGDGNEAGRVRLAMALTEYEEGNRTEARDLFQKVLEDRTLPANLKLEAELGLGRIYAEEYNFREARPILEALVEKDMPESMRKEVRKVLGDLNIRSIFSLVEADPEKDLVYHIQGGDKLINLSMKYGVTMEILKRKNNILDDRSLSVGKRLIIPEYNFRLEVDRFANTLTVYNNDKFFKEYPVRTGMYEYMTPLGEFTIQNKKINPQWTDPKTGTVFAGGDPQNQLGTRWMAFQSPMLGIHGTIFPETIGLYTSHGCVGMLMEDVEELHGIIPVGTPLTIRGGRNPEIEKTSAKYIQNADPSLSGV